MFEVDRGGFEPSGTCRVSEFQTECRCFCNRFLAISIPFFVRGAFVYARLVGDEYGQSAKNQMPKMRWCRENHHHPKASRMQQMLRSWRARSLSWNKMSSMRLKQGLARWKKSHAGWKNTAIPLQGMLIQVFSALNFSFPFFVKTKRRKLH
jgi:hypothetical protein